uniref:Uncharacterized protein n=1 Tax=Eutreptiella gymnastica TaxID=73025 RepID=A0A7S4GBD2_9EUGL
MAGWISAIRNKKQGGLFVVVQAYAQPSSLGQQAPERSFQDSTSAVLSGILSGDRRKTDCLKRLWPRFCCLMHGSAAGAATTKQNKSRSGKDSADRSCAGRAHVTGGGKPETGGVDGRTSAEAWGVVWTQS